MSLEIWRAPWPVSSWEPRLFRFDGVRPPNTSVHRLRSALGSLPPMTCVPAVSKLLEFNCQSGSRLLMRRRWKPPHDASWSFV